jgi:hypothetical protein
MREIVVIEQIFDTLTDLTDQQRLMIKHRYRYLMTQYQYRALSYSMMFYMFRLTVTLGSLSVPALLTIQNTPGASQVMYWFTWALSLAVTMANGLMLLFKLDKRYFMMNAVIERLRSDTWQYIELSGRYSGHHLLGEKATHANQYVYYCTHIERINMKWVDDEYIKTGEEKVNSPPSQQQVRDISVPSPPEQIELILDEERISGIEIEGRDEKDHAKSHKKLKGKKEHVSLSERTVTVSESPTERHVVLQVPPEVQGQPDDGSRAAV